jgi:lysophospholipase L1-like esterase
MRNSKIARGFLGILLLLPGIRSVWSGQIRVACLGNGVTEGSGLSFPSGDSYPAQLGALLGGRYDVRNFGASGSTVLKKGDRPFREAGAFGGALAYQPDVAVFCFGADDSKPWNWTSRKEFIADYIALIDTFFRLGSRPLAYLGYPPPVFNNAYDISDSILAREVLPSIDSVRSAAGVPLIDFNAPLRDRGGLFPDGIHPDVEGARLMAGIAFEKLTGIHIRRVSDPDLARGRPVTASGFEENPPGGLNDGDSSTRWTVRPPAWAVIDLGEERQIELFQTDFGTDRSKGILYTISISSDSIEWRTVADHGADPDTTRSVRVDRIDPAAGRYVRLALYYGFYADDKNAPVSVRDFRVRRHTGAVHAPLLSWRALQIGEKRMKYEVRVTPSGDSGEVAVIYRALEDSAAYAALAGYRTVESSAYTVFAQPGETHRYYALGFRGGREVLSDTLTVRFENTGIPDEGRMIAMPGDILLHPNYPNPFNPATRLRFDLVRPSRVMLRVYDLRGRPVRALMDQSLPAGSYAVQWDGGDDAGNPLPSGVYVGRLTTARSAQCRKMILLR